MVAPHARRLAVPTLALLMLASAPAAAQQHERNWLFRVAFESGGDELFEGRLDNGDDVDISAGGLVAVELGLRRQWLASLRPEWESELSVGYKADSVEARNGNLGFRRFTLNALQHYRVSERVRLGAGVTYHLGVEFEADAADVPGIGEFTREGEGALGALLAADYAFNDRVDLGLRATLIDYDFEADESGGAATVDGDSVGLYLTLRF